MENGGGRVAVGKREEGRGKKESGMLMDRRGMEEKDIRDFQSLFSTTLSPSRSNPPGATKAKKTFGGRESFSIALSPAHVRTRLAPRKPRKNSEATR